jgi:hypothetical protein
MRNAGCPLNRATPVWHYFDFFVRLASASVPSEALTLISRQSLHAEDGLRMDEWMSSLSEYGNMFYVKKDSRKALSKAQAVSVNFR